jgi:hypothetical protein
MYVPSKIEPIKSLSLNPLDLKFNAPLPFLLSFRILEPIRKFNEAQARFFPRFPRFPRFPWL